VNALDLPEALYQKLRGHLLRDEREQVAFVFAHAEQNDDRLALSGVEAYLVPTCGLDHQSAFHISLTDSVQARIIKSAWDRGCALVEFHSHPRSHHRVKFSESDIHGLSEFVPHVRWRLRGQPYLAVVLGQFGFDALLWRQEWLEGLDVMTVGGEVHRPTGLTLKELRRNVGGTLP